MNVTCENVRTLLSSYLDGELSEEQAKPARAHLMDCRNCREAVQEGKVIRRWLRDAELPVEVPMGFAARVARRAFAGDPGLLVPQPGVRGEKSLLPFVLKLAAVAAVVLFLFSLLIQKESLPSGEEIQATDQSWMFEEHGPNAEPLASEEDAEEAENAAADQAPEEPER